MMNMLTSLEINEALGNVTALSGTRYKVRLIEGDKLGSMAYYPAEVVRRDGPLVFKKGTPMFIDHQTPEEKARKPYGSIHSFVGELAEDAYYENDGLYAEVEVFEDAAPMIKARADKIGISVRANIVGDKGVINGKQVNIAQQFTDARSVDFVMRAGAGGKIVSILESAVEETPESGIEESGENMDEVLARLQAFEDKFDSRLTTIEEGLKKAPVEESKVEVEADVEAKALEIAEAFVDSTLDPEGRKRVLALHKATGTAIAELIEAEEAYVKAHTANETEGVEGVEESAVEESATKTINVPLPGAWLKKDK